MYILVHSPRKYNGLNIRPITTLKIEAIRDTFDIKPAIIDTIDHIVDYYVKSKSIVIPQNEEVTNPQ